MTFSSNDLAWHRAAMEEAAVEQSKKTSGRLKGHALLGEGAPHGTVSGIRVNYSGVSGEGCGKCECGAMSPNMFSAADRRRWHKQHKEAQR